MHLGLFLWWKKGWEGGGRWRSRFCAIRMWKVKQCNKNGLTLEYGRRQTPSYFCATPFSLQSLHMWTYMRMKKGENALPSGTKHLFSFQAMCYINLSVSATPNNPTKNRCHHFYPSNIFNALFTTNNFSPTPKTKQKKKHIEKWKQFCKVKSCNLIGLDFGFALDALSLKRFAPTERKWSLMIWHFFFYFYLMTLLVRGNFQHYQQKSLFLNFYFV